nr:hypothetical protein [Tanacetum cinerariifolium]
MKYALIFTQQQQQYEFLQLDSGLTVLVFKQDDDPTDAINHMMSFISTVVTSRLPTTNNQLRNSSNPRQQATINDGSVTLQPVRGRQISFATCTNRTYTLTASESNSGKQIIVICYNYAFDSDYEELNTAKVSLMANLSHYGSDALAEKAQQLEPKLYYGNVIKNTCAIVIPNSKETLMLAEENHSKMILKQQDSMVLEKKVNTTPIDYVVLNQLSQDFEKQFVPQTELSAKQAFWSQNSINSLDLNLSKRPTKVEVPKELPKVSMTLREYYKKVGISHETFVARSPQQNCVVERQNRTLIEAAHTMLIYAKAHLFLWAKAVATAYFDELTAMASEHSSSEPILHEITPATISLGLVPNPPPSTPFVPPSRTDWDLLFQPLFDELLTLPPSVDYQAPKVIALNVEVVALEPTASTGSPSPTTIDQDAPSPINTQTTPETQTLVISNDVEKGNHDLDIAHMNNDPCVGIEELPKTPTFRDDPLHEYLHEDSLLKDHHRISDKPTLHSKHLDNPSHVYKLKKALYGLKQAPRAWYDMLSRFLISQHFSKGAVDPILFTRKAGNDLLLAKPTEKHLKTIKRIFRYLKGTINMGLWYLKDTDMSLTAFADADHTGCQDTRRSTSGNYGFQFNKTPLYFDNKSAIALCYDSVQHSKAKHIDVRYHFIKEQVEDGSMELYFVWTEYQLADIFTRPLPRERFNFLIEKLGIKSMSLDTLKRLAEETDE